MGRPARDARQRSSSPTQRPTTSRRTASTPSSSTPDEALAAAGDKDVDVLSASIGQQLLRAGRVDEIRIHLVPVLFGTGTRLIDDLWGRHIRLERLGASESANGQPPALRRREGRLISRRGDRHRSSTGSPPGRVRW